MKNYCIILEKQIIDTKDRKDQKILINILVFIFVSLDIYFLHLY